MTTRPPLALLLALAAFAAPLGAQERPASAPAAPLLDSGPRAWEDRAYDLVHFDFDLAFDLAARTVRGRIRQTLEPLSPNLREIPFDAEDLVVKGATVDGRSAPVRTQAGKLFVGIPAPAPAGARLEVVIDYEAAPTTGLHWNAPEPGHEAKGWQCYSQGEAEDNHHWLPIHDYPNDRATWSCTLHVPSDLTAVSNGRLLDVSDDPGGATRAWRYAMEQPNVTYLVSVAIGPWERYADDWNGIPVEYFVARGTGQARARLAFGRTPEMIQLFSDWTGMPYPFPKYSQTAVADFVVGGMENVSATTQTDNTLHDERTHLERDSEGLVSHELAHQWWGDALTCNGWRHLWLNEGFATYFTALWLEGSRGLDAYRLAMDGQRRAFLAADPVDAPRALVTTPANRRDDAPNAHVYTKGSSVLHMLRFVVGDADFRRAIALYARRHAMGLVETRDLERAFSDVTGRSLEWFWQEWAYLAGAPSLEVAHEWNAEKGALAVTVRQAQPVSARVPLFKMPVDLLLGFPDGSTEVKRVWFENAEHRFEFTLPRAPAFVRFDEGSWLAARVKHPRSVEELAAQAAGDPDVVGRKEACERLGEALQAKDAPRAEDALAAALAPKEHREVRAAAAAALRHGRSPAARAALLGALADADANVRRSAADALSGAGRDPSAVEALTRLARTDPAYGPRAAAARSLGAMLGAESWELCAEIAEQGSERDVVRIAALETLRRLDGARALPLLLASARPGSTYEARDRALSLLVSVATAEDTKKTVGAEARAAIREALAAAAASTNWRLRTAALRQMGSLDDPDLSPALERGAASRDPRDRRAAEGAQAARKARKEKGSAPAGAP